jgi:hypothetical protein
VKRGRAQRASALAPLLLVALLATPPTAEAADDAAAVRELEAKCQAARQRKLAPLREERIAECRADRRNDPAFCERHIRDYGEGGPGPNGTRVTPMFNDLPECVAAFAARDALRRQGRR